MKRIATSTISLMDGTASYGLVDEAPRTIPFVSLPELRQAICDSPDCVQGDLADFQIAGQVVAPEGLDIVDAPFRAFRFRLFS